MRPEDLAHHPIVRAALEAHGSSPGEAIDSPEWRRHETMHYGLTGDRTLPSVNVSMTDAVVMWERDAAGQADVSFHIERIRGGWLHVVNLRRLSLPDTALAALTGSPLERVVALPGGRGFEIMRAQRQFGTDLHIEPWRRPD